MKSLRHILFGLVIGFLLVLALGAAYDKTWIQHDPYYMDGFGPYIGTDGDSYMEWDSSNGEFDWVIAAGSINITLTGQSDDMAGLYVNCTVPTGQQSWGAVYGDMTIAGTTDGTCAALSGIVWTDSSSAPVGIVAGAKVGVSDTGGDLDSATIVGLYIENNLAAAGSDPLKHYMMYFNCNATGETPDYWFHSVGPQPIAYAANTVHTSASASKVGVIKISIGTVGDCYLYVYDHVGE